MKSLFSRKLRNLNFDSSDAESEIFIILTREPNIQSVAESLKVSSRTFSEVKKDLFKPYTEGKVQSVTLLTKDERRIIIAKYGDKDLNGA